MLQFNRLRTADHALTGSVMQRSNIEVGVAPPVFSSQETAATVQCSESLA